MSAPTGDWRKSSYSTQGSNCVYVARIPVTWQKSSFSGEAANCLHLAAPYPRLHQQVTEAQG
ncbi:MULTISPECIES: DUF397 domain-containing protein [Streptomyces]|uniref:DUF397 domain-containing protein n=1 Tax=Streptomyces lonegramiae TaxID=3075524 RepID=A0ABU2XCV0_9ACTN|nr:DUF397 domain-containing protein [Streptomyces sp. DSM 41529]MDT0543299.1 DUF397 domain-containing protein [Streptomyces sp. DSM 41529]